MFKHGSRIRFSFLSGGFLLLLLVATGCGSGGPATMMSPDPEPLGSITAAPANTAVVLDAVVTAVTDPRGVLGGVIHAYDAVSGVLEFDDSVEDSHRKTDSGRYMYRGSDARMRCEIRGLVFESDADALDLTIRLLNDKKTRSVRDSFDADSKSNLEVLPGVGVSGITLTVTDDTATALDDDALAGLAISLSHWTGGVIVITGADGWRIEATLSAFMDNADARRADESARNRRAEPDERD